MSGKFQPKCLKQYELDVALMELIIQACQQMFSSSTNEQQVVTLVSGHSVELCNIIYFSENNPYSRPME